MKKVAIGVIGVGKLGNYHCNVLNDMPGADFVGVYDVEQNQRNEIAKKYGVTAFSSVDELLEKVQAVTVAVPTVDHLATCTRALGKDKAVFVEKPIAGSVEEADEMIQLASKRGLTLQVGHIERFNEAVLAIRDMSLSPRFIESHRLAPFDPRGTDVAVVLDLMIHDIDIILSLVRSPVQYIEANGVAVISHEPDIANARISFENGCVANVTASRISQKKMRKMRLFQQDTYISIDFLMHMTEVFKLVNDEAEDSDAAFSATILGKIDEGQRKRKIVYEKLEPPSGNALQLELESFIRAIETGTTPEVTGEDARQALAVASEITYIVKRNAQNL